MEIKPPRLRLPLVDTLNIDAAILWLQVFDGTGAILELVRKGRIESVMILGEDQGKSSNSTSAKKNRRWLAKP